MDEFCHSQPPVEEEESDSSSDDDEPWNAPPANGKTVQKLSIMSGHIMC